MTQVTNDTSRSVVTNVPQLKGINYVELYVGNAHQAMHFYRTTFGFRPVAYSGPETGQRDRVSFLVEQGNIRLIFTAPTGIEGPIAEHIALHGDGVKDIAFSVENAAATFEYAVSLGARPVAEPAILNTAAGRLTHAAIGVYGDTVHSLVERDSDDMSALPNFQPIAAPAPATTVGLTELDHIAVCVDAGSLNRWSDFYKQVFGFEQVHEENVETGLSAMNSRAVQDPSGKIKFPMQEPAPSKRKSQIEEYLESYHGAGVQHLAVLTDDIVSTVRALRANGIEFRHAPGTYFDILEERVGKINVDVEGLRDLHILVDRDKWGYLLQIFAKPVQSRPTLFCEIIQRVGARGFGSGNIKALFESIEREQALRGTL